MELSIFRYSAYRSFVVDWVKSSPGGGKGQYKRMAEALGTYTSQISLIFNGSRDLTLEQALGLSEFLKLSGTETEYLVTLVQRERAGTPALKKHFEQNLKRIRRTSEEVSVSQTRDPLMPLNSRQQEIFYSAWYYSAIKLLVSIPGFNTVESVAKYFGLKEALVRSVVDFLVETGLCAESRGKITVLVAKTHLGSSSILRDRHYLNWRLLGLQSIPKHMPHEFFYSSAMSISERDAGKVRDFIHALVKDVDATLKDSAPAKLMCLNIDWFDL